METGLEDLVIKKEFRITKVEPEVDFRTSSCPVKDVSVTLSYDDGNIQRESEMTFSLEFLRRSNIPVSKEIKEIDLAKWKALEITLTPRRIKDYSELKENEMYLIEIRRLFCNLGKHVKNFVSYCRLAWFPGIMISSKNDHELYGTLECGLNEEEFRELSKPSASEYAAVGVSMRLYDGTQADLAIKNQQDGVKGEVEEKTPKKELPLSYITLFPVNPETDKPIQIPVSDSSKYSCKNRQTKDPKNWQTKHPTHSRTGPSDICYCPTCELRRDLDSAG